MSDEEKTDDESEESGMVSGGHADRVADRLSKQNAMARISTTVSNAKNVAFDGLGERGMFVVGAAASSNWAKTG